MKGFIALNVFLSVLILLSNAGCHISVVDEEQIMERIEKTYSVNAGGNLTIVSDIGAIDVQTADQNQVEIVVTKAAKSLNRSAKEALADFEVAFSPEDTDVHIEGRFKHGRERWRKILNRLKIRFHVTVPKDYNVDLETQTGSIKVGNLDGKVRAHTSGGHLRFGNITGTVWGRIENITGIVWERTSGGNIKVENCNSSVDVQTSAGNIKLESVGGDVNAKTSAGNIQATMTAQPQNECSLRTSAGNITVTLIPDVTVDMDAETWAGNVSTDFTVAPVIQRKFLKNGLKGSINGGGPLLKLRTSAGNIHLQKAAD